MSGSISVKPKKRGRPATGRERLVGVRYGNEALDRLDAHAEREGLTRSEAVGQLVEKGIAEP